MKRNTWKDYETSQELIYNIRRRHMQKKFRKRRIGVALTVCALVVLMITTVVFANGEKKEITYAPVAVESGDSLWTLAATYYPNTNRKAAIEEIKKVNGLTGSTIYEGDVLMLPEIG